MLVRPKRGPCKIEKILDHENIIVTDSILEYLGPNYNWHNIQFTPSFFNKESLTFYFIDNRSITFNKEDPMNIEL